MTCVSTMQGTEAAAKAGLGAPPPHQLLLNRLPRRERGAVHAGLHRSRGLYGAAL